MDAITLEELMFDAEETLEEKVNSLLFLKDYSQLEELLIQSNLAKEVEEIIKQKHNTLQDCEKTLFIIRSKLKEQAIEDNEPILIQLIKKYLLPRHNQYDKTIPEHQLRRKFKPNTFDRPPYTYHWIDMLSNKEAIFQKRAYKVLNEMLECLTTAEELILIDNYWGFLFGKPQSIIVSTIISKKKPYDEDLWLLYAINLPDLELFNYIDFTYPDKVNYSNAITQAIKSSSSLLSTLLQRTKPENIPPLSNLDISAEIIPLLPFHLIDKVKLITEFINQPTNENQQKVKALIDNFPLDELKKEVISKTFPEIWKQFEKIKDKEDF